MIDTSKRNREIVALRDCGMSYSKIGIKFCLSPARIKQIYNKEKRRIDSEKKHLDAINGKTDYIFMDALLEVCDTEKLATRILRCLSKCGIIREIDINPGSLDSYSDETLLSIRNFGQKSLIFARKANELYKSKVL